MRARLSAAICSHVVFILVVVGIVMSWEYCWAKVYPGSKPGKGDPFYTSGSVPRYLGHRSGSGLTMAENIPK